MNKAVELSLEQGSPEWIAHRRTTFNASELAAAMGISPYISRNELIRVYARDTEIEYSNYVKNVIFPNGHRVEAIIRGHAEEFFVEDFIPKVFMLGKYACSLDGQTPGGDTNLEIKQYNKELYESVSKGILPDHHKPQVQQGLFITGAEYTIFAVSSEDEQDFVFVLVEPDPAFFDTIPRIWEKFAEDVANYTDIEQVQFLNDVEKDARLPVVKLSSGGIAVSSNIKAWFSEKKQAFDKLPKTINQDSIGDFQTTRDNFKEALPLIQHLRKGLEENAKPLVDVIAELVDIEKYLKKGVTLCDNTLTDYRRSVRQEACDKAQSEFSAYLEEKNKLLHPIKIVVDTPDFMGCCSRTKNHDSLGSAIGAEMANAKIKVDQIFEDLFKKLEWHKAEATFHAFLFSDLQAIIYKPEEDFMLIVKSRIAGHKKAEEDRLERERERIRAEEQAKAHREAEEKARREESLRLKEAERQRKQQEADQKAAQWEEEQRENGTASKLDAAKLEEGERLLGEKVVDPLEKKLNALVVRVKAGDISLYDALEIATRIGMELAQQKANANG